MRTAVVVMVLGTIAACSTAAEPDVESRRSIPEESATSEDVNPDEDTSTTTSTSTVTTTTIGSSATVPEPSGDEPPMVEFVLDDVIVEVTAITTSAPVPPGGSDGFRTAVQLDDDTFVAAGFDTSAGFAEHGALWRSDDGATWERIDPGVGDLPGVQDIVRVVATSDGPRVFGMEVDVDADPVRLEHVEWIRPTPSAWSTRSVAPDASVRDSVVAADDVSTVGADRWNTPGEFRAVVIAHAPDGGAERTTYLDVDAGGEPLAGSEVNAVAVDPDEPSNWLAVGHTIRTDSSSTGSERAIDAGLPAFPSDVAIWRSSDAGASWTLSEVERFADVPGAQGASSVVRAAGDWWMLTGEQSLGNSFARRLYRSPDGIDWTLDDHRRPEPLTGNETPGARGVWAVDDIVVVVDEVIASSGRSLVMTMIDPSTGARDQHDLTVGLDGVERVEDVIELIDGSRGLGFGRVERGRDESDLQVIEIRRREEPPPEPDSEPAPTTTAPPSGGGSSNA